MNVQKHHYMNKLRDILIIAVALFGAASTSHAQIYETVESRNVWNRGNNVTGLLRDSITISNAELFGSYQEGDFRDFSDATNLYSAGVEAKTLTYREKLAMIGAFTYSHSQGEEMSGSMFIDPSYYPVDILEFTPGDKTLQDYYFMGGLATEILPRLNIGALAEFRSQNYAKYKDLRHYNYRMELKLAPSISYSIGDALIGASYIYTKDSETIRAKEIGSTAEQYDAFLDKGLMRGAFENWEGSGVHLTESGVDGFPVAQSGHGVALQFDYMGLYAEAQYSHAEGTIGEKQTIWYNFPSNTIAARLAYTLHQGGNQHLISLEAQHYNMVNRENVVNTESNNGVSTTITYGANQIFATEQLTIAPKYELHLTSGAYVELGAKYYSAESQSTLMYPYVDALSLHYCQGYINGIVPFGRLMLRAGLLYSSGDYSDESYSVETDSTLSSGESQTRLEEYYNIENEYLVATRIGGSLAVRYTTAKNFYCEVGASIAKAFDLQYIAGDNRNCYSIKLGYNF